MPVQKASRDKVLASATKVIRKKGYNATSMADIANETGLLKGSLYHYFPSKEDLMTEVLRKGHEGASKGLFKIAYDKSKTPEQRMRSFFKKTGGEGMIATGGCMMGNTSLEIADTNPMLRDCVRDFFQDWIDAVANIYASNHTKDEATELAELALQEFEGAIMLSKTFQNPRYFEKAVARILSRL